MKYFIISGEASGDLHASHLVKQIKLLDVDANIVGWGGDKMAQEGVVILKHIRELAFMGFVEVIQHLVPILRNFVQCKRQLSSFKPDVVILVDYPGFNLRMAKWAKGQGMKVAYYISPTVWAWKENRVEIIRKYTDRMICILPFEKAFYASKQLEVDYVGNPTAELVEEEKKKASSIMKQNVIALLPGSRKQEIRKMLPIMLAATADLNDYHLMIAQAPNLTEDIYKPYLENYSFELVQHKTYDILKVAKAAIVTSGTATLETALFKVPQVVCYIANGLSYAIAKRLVKVKYISLVNLILNRESVKELIQEELSVASLKEELHKLLFDAGSRRKLQNDYDELDSMLKLGGASVKTAAIIYILALKQ